MKIQIALILLLCCVPLWLSSLDLAKPGDYLKAYMRVRGDASGEECVYYWTGKVYSFIPGEKRMELFDFEGYNIIRTVVTEQGFKLLSREAAFFKDPRTSEILESWRNLFTGNTVPVVHVFNDPVNQEISFTDDFLPYVHQVLPSTDLGNTLVFNMDIFPFYPNPLNTRDHGEYVRSDTYQAAEFFQYFVSKDALSDESLSSVPADISWTRISPWMPFMRMADRAGNLIFVCRGKKQEGGFKGLPQHIQDYVLAHEPAFVSAPREWSEPNETSWTYFKKLIEEAQSERNEP